jgi:hypothetical protein
MATCTEHDLGGKQNMYARIVFEVEVDDNLPKTEIVNEMENLLTSFFEDGNRYVPEVIEIHETPYASKHYGTIAEEST